MIVVHFSYFKEVDFSNHGGQFKYVFSQLRLVNSKIILQNEGLHYFTVFCFVLFNYFMAGHNVLSLDIPR